jgi:hypothetical protein
LSLCNKEDIKWDHDQNGVITITADIFNWWIFVLRDVDSFVYNARNTHLGVQAFSKPVFKIATLEWVCRFFTGSVELKIFWFAS